MTKGHHSTAGIVPVLLDGFQVAILHRLAAELGLLDQQAAQAVLCRVLSEWDAGIMEIERLDHPNSCVGTQNPVNHRPMTNPPDTRPVKRGPGRPIQHPCPSPQAILRHKRRKEPLCDACQALKGKV